MSNYTSSNLINPSTYYIPRLSEMKKSNTKVDARFQSLLDDSMNTEEVLCLVFGGTVMDIIARSNIRLYTLLVDTFTIFSTTHRKMLKELDNKTKSLFPKYHGQECSLQDAELKRINFKTFFGSVFHTGILKSICSQKQAGVIRDFLEEKVSNWPSDEPLCDMYPVNLDNFSQTIRDIVKKMLEKCKMIANLNDLMNAININMIHFFILYYLYLLRRVTKLGISPEGKGVFYYLETYKKAIEHLKAQENSEEDDNVPDVSQPSVSQPIVQKDKTPEPTSPTNKKLKSVKMEPTEEIEYNPLKVKKEKKDKLEKQCDTSSTYEEKRKRKAEQDSTIQYDPKKVKLEKGIRREEMKDSITAKHHSETGSVGSSAESPIDEWDAMLTLIDSIPEVPKHCKILVRCVVANNRDLRASNDFLKSLLAANGIRRY